MLTDWLVNFVTFFRMTADAIEKIVSFFSGVFA